MSDREFFDGLARLRTTWDDRRRLVWVPWLAGAFALFGIAKHFFERALG